MRLVRPTQPYSDQINAYRTAFLNNGEHPYGGSSIQNIIDTNEWIQHVRKQEKGEELPRNRVPATQFISIVDEQVVGVVNIRHRLTPELLLVSGHIGYSIHPDQRKKGYATEQLRLSLLEAKKLGLDKVLVTCDKTNIGSAKTIQKVGGILENEVISPETNELVQRYWINISE